MNAWWWAVAWADERPLTYTEALSAAAEANGAAVRGDYGRERAEAAQLSARGLFDPLVTTNGTWGFLAFDDVRDALPISGDDRSWTLGTSIGGTTGSGTTYLLSAGAGYERSWAAGLQPRYDEDGDQIGTAPFEATLASYASTVNVTLSQQLLRGVSMSYNLQTVQLARRSWTTAERVAEQTRQQAMADAALAYWTWVYAYRVHQIDETAVSVASEALRVAGAQVEARQLAPVERTRTEAALVLARASAIDSGVLATQARDQLLVVMGEIPGQDILPATDPGEPPPITVDLEAAVAVALAQNLDLAVARSTREGQELVRKAARHARLPTLEALVSVGRTTGNQPTFGTAVGGVLGAAGQPNVLVGGTFQVPVGNWAAVGAARAAELDLLVAESTVDELERLVRAQVAHQVAALDASRQRIDLADANVVLATEVLDAMDALASANRAIPKDQLEARTLLDRARVEAVKARIDWRLAHTELVRLQAGLTASLSR